MYDSNIFTKKPQTTNNFYSSFSVEHFQFHQLLFISIWHQLLHSALHQFTYMISSLLCLFFHSKFNWFMFRNRGISKAPVQTCLWSSHIFNGVPHISIKCLTGTSYPLCSKVNSSPLPTLPKLTFLFLRFQYQQIAGKTT